MNNTPLISIIVPCYNVQDFLRSCIDSVLSQTYSNWELLIIDDGSTDDSGAISDEYRVKDGRISVIHKQNEGTSLARWTGVNKSNGDWVMFVDGDDTLPPAALDSYARKISEDTNIIIGSYIRTVQNKPSYSPDEYRLGNIASIYFPVATWCHLYRKSLLSYDDFCLTNVLKGEDALMNIRVAFKNNLNVLTVREITYNYNTNNPNSVVHTHKASMDYAQMFNELRINQIPKNLQRKYSRANTYIMWKTIMTLAYMDRNNLSWMDHPYYKQLLNAISNSRLSLTFLEHRLLVTHNLVLRMVIRFCLRVDRKIRKERYNHTKSLM